MPLVPIQVLVNHRQTVGTVRDVTGRHPVPLPGEDTVLPDIGQGCVMPAQFRGIAVRTDETAVPPGGVIRPGTVKPEECVDFFIQDRRNILHEVDDNFRSSGAPAAGDTEFRNNDVTIFVIAGIDRSDPIDERIDHFIHQFLGIGSHGRIPDPVIGMDVPDIDGHRLSVVLQLVACQDGFEPVLHFRPLMPGVVQYA